MQQARIGIHQEARQAEGDKNGHEHGTHRQERNTDFPPEVMVDDHEQVALKLL